MPTATIQPPWTSTTLDHSECNYTVFDSALQQIKESLMSKWHCVTRDTMWKIEQEEYEQQKHNNPRQNAEGQ